MNYVPQTDQEKEKLAEKYLLQLKKEGSFTVWERHTAYTFDSRIVPEDAEKNLLGFYQKVRRYLDDLFYDLIQEVEYGDYNHTLVRLHTSCVSY
jgi:hypothetical protein